MAASPKLSRTTSQPPITSNAAAKDTGDLAEATRSKEGIRPSKSIFARSWRQEPQRTGSETSGLRLRDGPPGHDFSADELKRLRFQTSLGKLRLPVQGMPPLKPTDDMIRSAQEGVLRGYFQESYLIPAIIFGDIVDPRTATLYLDDKYEFLPEPLVNQDNGKAEDRFFARLYFISICPGELPSFYFWQPKSMPSPVLRTHHGTAIQSESEPDQTMLSPDDDLSPPSSQNSDSSESDSEPSSNEDFDADDTESDSLGYISEDESSTSSGSDDPGNLNGKSGNEKISPISRPTMNFQETMESKRPVGTFPLFSSNFPPKLVHGRKGAIQIRDFRNFAVWEATILKLIGNKRKGAENPGERQIPKKYIVNLWLTRNGKSELYCGWKMAPGRKELFNKIINTLNTFPEMARERCVLRVHRLGDKDYRLFPPPEFADGKTFCIYNPYVGYSWVRIPWGDINARATNSEHFVSHLHWLFPKAGSEYYTRYAIEIAGLGSFMFNTEKPSEAMSDRLQSILAKVLANATSPKEMRVYNKEFFPSLIDCITMVRVARKRAVRSFREMNSRNFIGCFKRLYQISNAEWAIRVHPNDDHWVRDEWEFFSPDTSIAERHDQFNSNLRPLFRQYQNVIVSMCPRNIEVYGGEGKRSRSRTWAHTWESHPRGKRIRHSADDLALICKDLLGIDPRTDNPGIFIIVSRWKADKEFLCWHPGMSGLEWRREIYYKIDGSDIIVYPWDASVSI